MNAIRTKTPRAYSSKHIPRKGATRLRTLSVRNPEWRSGIAEFPYSVATFNFQDLHRGLFLHTRSSTVWLRMAQTAYGCPYMRHGLLVDPRSTTLSCLPHGDDEGCGLPGRPRPRALCIWVPTLRVNWDDRRHSWPETSSTIGAGLRYPATLAPAAEATPN